MPSETIRTGGGRFDPDAGHMFFASSQPDKLEWARKAHDNLLIAVNELGSAGSKYGDALASWLRDGHPVLLDSGVFSTTMAYAKSLGISFYDALKIPAEEVPGFEQLLAKYEAIVHLHGDELWGYVEVDQGGPKQKTERREAMERRGFRPFPVYHSLTDGLEYFDYLASRYDRICVANLVQTSREWRIRLLATITERRKRFPGLRWIHLLGYSPDAITHAYPVESTDASSFLNGVRWGAGNARTLNTVLGPLLHDFSYQMGADPLGPKGHRKAIQMAGYIAHFDELAWDGHQRRLAATGLIDPRDARGAHLAGGTP